MQQPPINWFDFLVVVVILLGVRRGKARGMSEELLDTAQWLAIIPLSAMASRPLGELVFGYTNIPLLFSVIFAYVLTALVIKLAFGRLKAMSGEKVVQSDFFGRGEYILGMLAGAVRYSCVLLFAVALVGAREYSETQLKAQSAAQQEAFGNIRLPTWGSVQQQVFVESATGPYIQIYLKSLLIDGISFNGFSESKTPAKKRELEMNKVLGE